MKSFPFFSLVLNCSYPCVIGLLFSLTSTAPPHAAALFAPPQTPSESEISAPSTNESSGQVDATTSPKSSAKSSLTSPIIDTFTPSIADRDLDAGQLRAWEFRPYRVAVWICLDGSPELNAISAALAMEVESRSEIIDPSGWDLAVGPAPSQYRWRFLESIHDADKLVGIEKYSTLESYDKLMVVCLNAEFGRFQIRVRDFDLQTQQWGPLVNRSTGNQHRLDNTIVDAISVAFMPLARVDRIITKDRVPQVFVQARAIDASRRARLNESLEWEMVTVSNSPVIVKSDDRFQPVIRRTDRAGKLLGLNPIEFTFLMIEERTDTEIRCSIQSSERAPLAGRSSKLAEKLALVIRAPQRPSTLYLESRDKPKIPLEGFEIWSRPPSATQDDASEFLGKTDWQGAIEIPPSEEGLRLIYVKRGSRALKKIPIIPGLYETLTTTVPNDETSLYAEGIINGLEKEILNLVIQRDVFQADIEDALSKKALEEAKKIFKEYQTLESIRDLKTRMANEESRLKNLTQDKRELTFIQSRFDNLRNLLNIQGERSKETQLQQEIQQQSGIGS